MNAIDTNVIVRYLEQDDEGQFHAVLHMLAAKSTLYYLDDVTLVEAWWVLSEVYDWSQNELVGAYEELLNIYNIVFEDEQRVRRCLRAVKQGADFPDEMITLRGKSAGCTKMATFDKKIVKRHLGYAYIPTTND